MNPPSIIIDPIILIQMLFLILSELDSRQKIRW